MSKLKEAAWKSILSKPKNLGLKVAGTGISVELRKLEQYEDWYGTNPTLENAKILGSHLWDLIGQCEVVIKKHGKLFTEACTHLKGVQEEARERFNLVNNGVLFASKYKEKYADASLKPRIWNGKEWVKRTEHPN